ncbi:MAG TPA: thioredoxin family protein, partial [Myxococcota bacterium]
KGATLMFFYALGMGLPFLVLGTFSQAIARMPKSGKWMETVKSVFGLLMLGAGLYYLQIGIPAVADVFAPLGRSGLLGPVLIVVGIAIGALHLSFKYTPVVEKVRKGVGVAAATVGVVAFLAWTNASPEAHGAEIAWVHVKDTPDTVAVFDAALAAAKAEGKPVFIDFGADWCIACKEFEKYTFVDAAVKAEAERFVAIKVDATNETEGLTAIQKRFGVVGLPTIAFVPGSGDYLDGNQQPKHPAVTGFLKAPEFLPHLQRVQ